MKRERRLLPTCQAIVAIESIRPDSLLKRMFKVFHTDQLKTHRLFAKIARFLNNGFKGLDKKMLWEGLKQLSQEQQIVLGRAADQIHELAKHRDADLIVIGSHGRHGWRRLLGSTANAVLHGAPVDVAVIRIPENEDA